MSNEAVSKGTILIPFRRKIYPYSVDTFPYFKVLDVRFGTKGYTYKLLGFNKNIKNWMGWPIDYAHTDLLRCFRLPKPAEEILYLPNEKKTPDQT